jgi:hypothetical protein
MSGKRNSTANSLTTHGTLTDDSPLREEKGREVKEEKGATAHPARVLVDRYIQAFGKEPTQPDVVAMNNARKVHGERVVLAAISKASTRTNGTWALATRMLTDEDVQAAKQPTFAERFEQAGKDCKRIEAQYAK